MPVRLLTRAVQCCQWLAPNRDRQGADANFRNLALALREESVSIFRRVTCPNWLTNCRVRMVFREPKP
jgi:hypothetical protein